MGKKKAIRNELFQRYTEQLIWFNDHLERKIKRLTLLSFVSLGLSGFFMVTMIFVLCGR